MIVIYLYFYSLSGQNCQCDTFTNVLNEYHAKVNDVVQCSNNYINQKYAYNHMHPKPFPTFSQDPAQCNAPKNTSGGMNGSGNSTLASCAAGNVVGNNSGDAMTVPNLYQISANIPMWHDNGNNIQGYNYSTYIPQGSPYTAGRINLVQAPKFPNANDRVLPV